MSLTEIDKALGFVAVHQRVLSQGQLNQALSALQQNPNAPGLGPMLVQYGLVTPQKLGDLMSMAQRRMGSPGMPTAVHPTNGYGAAHPPRPTPSSGGFSPLGASQQPVFSPSIRSMQSGKFRLDDINPQGRAIPQSGTDEHRKLREQYEEYVFSQLLMKQGLVSEPQLRGVFQRKGNFQQGALSLGRQLIAEGLLNPQVVAHITADLQKKIFACSSCGNCYYVEPTPQPQRFPCRRCNSQVEIPPIGAPGNGFFVPSPMVNNSGNSARRSGPMTAPTGSPSYGANQGYGASPGFSPTATPRSSGFMAPVAPPPRSNGSFGSAPGAGFGMSPTPAAVGLGGGPGGADFDPGTPLGQAAPGGDSCPEAFGDYDIEREIARGGMGVVYLAVKRETGEKCALKVMLESVSQNPKRLKRFQREIDAHRKLIHDNIVRILDAGKVDEFYYFTMEYVDGKPLDDRLKEELDLEIVMEILENICRATDYAHSQGVVHRDLKPANVLVTSDMIPKLTDFGLAKSADHVSVLTKTGAVVGTPYYLSPEQASGQSRDVDHRADVYALGVMMYEMITGRLPFTGKTSVELFRKIIHEDPIPPIKIKPQLTEEIQRVCMKALEKNPNDRYQSAGAVADDIRCLIEGKPISARKPSVVKQTLRRVRKKGLAPLVGIGGTVLALLGASLFAWQWHSSRQAAFQGKIAAEWKLYKGSVDKDKATVKSSLLEAARLTRVERGHDALDAVNRAIIFLALMEYRGGFQEKGNKLLRDAGGDFAEILSFITNGRTSDAQSKLTLFGVDLKKWPTPIKHDENVKAALKERDSDAEKAERRDITAQIFVARGYGKMVLNEQRALDDARLDFERVEKFIDSSGSLALIALGDLLVAEGKLEQAVQQYGTAIFNDKEAVGAYLGKARAYFLQEQYRSAYDILEAAAKEKLEPIAMGEVLAARAYATVKLGRPERAKDDAKKACELAPKSYRAWLSQAVVFSELGDHLGAEKPFKEAKRLAAEVESPEVLIQSCRYLLKRRLYKAALSEANEAKRLAERSMEALSTRALVHEFLLEEQTAKIDADNARVRCEKRHWKSKAIGLKVLARIYATNNEFPKALRYAKESVLAWSDSSECRLLHGYLLLSQDHSDRSTLDQAERLAKEVIKKGTDNVGGKRLLGLVIEASKDSTQRAQQKLKEVLRLRKTDARVLTVLATLAEGNDANDDDIKKFRVKALEVERDVATIEGDFLARAMAIVDRPIVPKDKDSDDIAAGVQIKKARATFEKTLFFNPQNVHALTMLGQLAIERADYKSAKARLDKACALNPLHAPAFLLRLEINSGVRGGGEDFHKEEANKDINHLRKLLKVSGSNIPKILRAKIEIKFRAKSKPVSADYKTIIAEYDDLLAFEPGNINLLDRKIKLLNKYRVSLKGKEGRDVDGQIAVVKSKINKIRSSHQKLYKSLEGPIKDLKEGSSRSPAEFWTKVNVSPRFFAPWEALCRAALSTKDFDTSVLALAQLSHLSPAHSDLYPFLFALAKEKGQVNTAQIIKNVKQLFKTKMNLTCSYFLEKTVESLIYTSAAVANNSSQSQALESIHVALQARPLSPLLHGLKAAVLISQNKNSEALRALELSHTLCEGRPNTSIELARLQQMLGDKDMVMRLLQSAQSSLGKLDPKVIEEFAAIKKEAPETWKNYTLP
jgi:tetratricopeptide (TPR) repeat protein/predicted Ser/Thr protein kinase